MGDEVLEINSRVAAALSSAALRDFLSQPSLRLLVRTHPEPEGGALLLGTPPHRADSPPAFPAAGSPGKAVPTAGAPCSRWGDRLAACPPLLWAVSERDEGKRPLPGAVDREGDIGVPEPRAVLGCESRWPRPTGHVPAQPCLPRPLLSGVTVPEWRGLRALVDPHFFF